MDLIKMKALIEAMIFASPEPLDTAGIASHLGVEIGTIEALLNDLEEDLARPGSGLRISKAAGGVSLVTDPELHDWVSAYLSDIRHAPLTDASMETLAIIAYKQPITKGEIEQIRGVGAESALITLAQRGLIAERGRKNTPGRPILYGTTKDFLIYLGLPDIGKLPGMIMNEDAEAGPKLPGLE